MSSAGQLPAFVLAPFAGVLVDRWNRHRLLMGTQTLAMLPALILAGLVLTPAEDIGNAIAIHSSMINGARLVGPALAGLLIPTVGEGVCFLLPLAHVVLPVAQTP